MTIFKGVRVVGLYAMKRRLASLYVLLLLLVPVLASARGLVPCGGENEPDCQSCHVVILTNNVISWLVMVLGTIAAIIIVYAGFKLLTAGGNGHAREDAKEMISNMIIGYVIVLAGWLVVDTGMKALVNQSNYGIWNEVQCVTQPIAKYGGEYVPADELEVMPLTASGLNRVAMSSGDVSMVVSSIRAAGDTVSMVEAAARQAGITDPRTIKTFTALVMQESSLCRNKVGPPTRYGTAYGCGQMLLSTARGLDPNATVERLRDDDAYNLSLSARFFSQQLARYNNNVRLTLASYNGGDKANQQSTTCPGQLVWECQQNEGYAQTRNYVSNITSVAAGL